MIDTCELFGLSANKETNINFSWKEFIARGKEKPDNNGNPDGWGIGYYSSGRCKIKKKAQSAAESELAGKNIYL
ncbi:MAG: class II glutamine amidotransferase [Candidatus Diapherotrites archaeon]|nr:class II glutamine amidotransferase [Candidatus Diapherotrites archaeon]